MGNSPSSNTFSASTRNRVTRSTPRSATTMDDSIADDINYVRTAPAVIHLRTPVRARRTNKRRYAATALQTNTATTRRSSTPATSLVRATENQSVQAGLASSTVVANSIATIDVEIPPYKVRCNEPKAETLDRSSDDEAYKCPVCFESVRTRQPTSTKCGHVFCNICIVMALDNNKMCPICNTKLTKRQLTRLYM